MENTFLPLVHTAPIFFQQDGNMLYGQPQQMQPTETKVVLRQRCLCLQPGNKTVRKTVDEAKQFVLVVYREMLRITCIQLIMERMRMALA